MARADIVTLTSLARGSDWLTSGQGAFTSLLDAYDRLGKPYVVPTLVANGTTNDAPALQAAINAAAPGTTILLPTGRIGLGSTVLVATHGITLRGMGAGQRSDASQGTSVGTRLEALTGFSGTANGLSTGAILRFAGTTAPLHGCALADLAIDGKSVGTTLDGVHWRSHSSTIDNVSVWKCTGDGIRVEGYDDILQPPIGWATYDSRFSRILAGYNATNFDFDAYAQDTHLIGSVFMYPTVDNIRIAAGSQQLTGCHTYSGGRYNIRFDGGSRTKIVNLKCEQSFQHGIYFDPVGGSDVMITSSNFKNNGHTADNTYDHIHVADGSVGWSRLNFADLNFSVAANASAVAPDPQFYYHTNRARYAVYLGSSSREPMVNGIQVGSGHVRTARVYDDAPTAFRMVAGVGTGLSYTTLGDGRRLWTNTTQPSGMVAGDIWLHDA